MSEKNSKLDSFFGDVREPLHLLRAKISIFKQQICSIERELESVQRDHKEILKELRERESKYRRALTNRRELSRISKGKGFKEQRRDANETLKELEHKKHEEMRVHNQMEKSLKSEKRKLERELQELKIKLEVMKSGGSRSGVNEQ